MTDGLYNIYRHGRSGAGVYVYACKYVCFYKSGVCARVNTCTRDYEERRARKSGCGGWGGWGVETFFFRSLKQYDTATRLHLACVHSPLCRSRLDIPRPPPTAAAAADPRRKYKNPRCECVARVAFVSCLHCSEIWRGRGFRIILWRIIKIINNYFFIHSESRARTSTGRKNCLLYLGTPWS